MLRNPGQATVTHRAAGSSSKYGAGTLFRDPARKPNSVRFPRMSRPMLSRRSEPAGSRFQVESELADQLGKASGHRLAIGRGAGTMDRRGGVAGRSPPPPGGGATDTAAVC